MNLFFGLPISAEHIHVMTHLLLEAHPHWQKHSAIRWTPLHNHHMTLHFLGSINPEGLAGLVSELFNYIQNVKNFSIKINKLYNFPKENSKLVAAYVDLSLPLAKLYNQLQQAVKNHQFPVERRAFLPHITLCRSHHARVLTMAPLLLLDYSIKISSLVLYQTQPTPHGNQYMPLREWPL